MAQLAGDAGVVLWDSVRMAFTGDVAQEHKGDKISSTEAHKRVKSRLRMSVVFLAVLLAVPAVRVVMLQSVPRGDYHEASVDQRTRIDVVRAARGVIFDRNGDELALSVPAVTGYADPRRTNELLRAAIGS